MVNKGIKNPLFYAYFKMQTYLIDKIAPLKG
jgi:hypothetical protein